MIVAPAFASYQQAELGFKTCGSRLLVLLVAEIGFTIIALIISRCEYIIKEWTVGVTVLTWLSAAVIFGSIIMCTFSLKLCICEDANISGYNTLLRVLMTMVILGFLGIQAFIFIWRYRYGCPSSANVALGRLARSAADEDWAAAYDLRLVPHEAWSDQPAAGLPRLRHPAPFVVLSHTAGPTCAGPAECGHLLRGLQQCDNFLVDSAGYVYVGRGADFVSAAQSAVRNCSLGVALLGDFEKHNMTREAAAALRQLLEVGVASGWLAADHRLVGHSQLEDRGVHGPGRWALAAVHNWPQRCLSTCSEGLICPAA